MNIKKQKKQKTTGSSIYCSESEARKFLFWPYCWDPNRCVLLAKRKQMLRKTPRVISYRISGVIEGNFSIRMASLMCILLQAWCVLGPTNMAPIAILRLQKKKLSAETIGLSIRSLFLDQWLWPLSFWRVEVLQRLRFQGLLRFQAKCSIVHWIQI